MDAAQIDDRDVSLVQIAKKLLHNLRKVVSLEWLLSSFARRARIEGAYLRV